ncbi:MAG TPA: glycine--tRNA ligase subunit beta [Terriglobales bacterium]
MPSGDALLIELGCEELPARMVESLARGFAENLMQRLQGAGLAGADAVPEVAWTPRRLLVRVAAVARQQPQREEEVVGPPARLAFAPDGSLTPQGLGFVTKNHGQAADAYKVTNPKGEYLALRRKTGGAKAGGLLLKMIPEAFFALALPRSMKWDGDLRFVRPLRWLLALHGTEVVPFRLGALTADRHSRGHRTLGAGFTVTSADEFPGPWAANAVVTSPQERRQQIRAAAGRQLQQNLKLREDAVLEETLVNLTEYPDAILGSFAAAYLSSLPEEVLVTVMRDHQKYLAVEDGAGKLAPHFLAVLNQKGDPQGLIRHGNERVLRARFSDAQFFFSTDRKIRLAERLPMLEQVTFQARLGSYRAKSVRMRAIAAWLAGQWNLTANARADAEQAAELAKCDLTTDLVKEFPELQGIMGGHYARAEGLAEPVAQAIADQYSFDTAPRSDVGAAVSLADKFDTIAGMFAIGEVPTGSADPFGLRRQGNGIIRTLIERRLKLSLTAALGFALSQFASLGLGALPESTAEFFKERLSFYLRESAGFEPAKVAAVLAAGADEPLDACHRAAALAAAPDLVAVAGVVKRARSIVKKEGGLEKWQALAVNSDLLRVPAEQDLRRAVEALPAGGDYAAELRAIALLAAPLENFFSQVRVNDDDPAVRANRLALLAATVARLNRVADFAELAG